MACSPNHTWLHQLNAEELCGVDILHCLPPPQFRIPTGPQLLAAIASGQATVIVAHGIPPDHFILLLPCHSWSISWLHLMASHDTLPHISARFLCITEYAHILDTPVNEAIANFMTYMLDYSHPIAMMRG